MAETTPTSTRPTTTTQQERPYLWRWQVIGPLLVAISVGAGALCYHLLQSWRVLHTPGSALDVSVTASGFRMPMLAKASFPDDVKQLDTLVYGFQKSFVITITNGHASNRPAKEVNIILPAKHFCYCVEHNGTIQGIKIGNGNIAPLGEDIAVEQTYIVYAWCDGALSDEERIAVQHDQGKEVVYVRTRQGQSLLPQYMPPFPQALLVVALALLFLQFLKEQWDKYRGKHAAPSGNPVQQQ